MAVLQYRSDGLKGTARSRHFCLLDSRPFAVNIRIPWRGFAVEIPVPSGRFAVRVPVEQKEFVKRQNLARRVARV
jgi:hypothetical protein